MTACGIRIAINDSETDDSVENDAAPWVEKVGKVRLTTGGGSWFRDGKPGVARIQVKVPLNLAAAIRTVCIGVTLEAATGSTLPDGVVSDTPPYRIVFSGDVVSIQSYAWPGWPDPDAIVEINAASDMSALMNRQARTPQALSSPGFEYGIRDLLQEIESAHGLTMSGNASFPLDADYYLLDRPAQKQATNGSWIRTALAGSGINMSEEWDGTIDAPELMWRADYQDPSYWTVSDTNYWTWEAGYPWELIYEDVGSQWADFNARVRVDGEAIGGLEYYGWAQLSGTAARRRCGGREKSVTSWINNEADARGAARRLIGRQGEPNYLKMNQVTANIEHLYGVLDSQGSPDPEIEILQYAACMPGDVIQGRTLFGDTHADYGDWPTEHPEFGDLYDALLALWYVVLEDNGEEQSGQDWAIRAVTREWDPHSGWSVTYGMDPAYRIPGTDILDYDSDSY